ncbi:kinesin-like protein KIF12 isoform X2 [Centruroides sculpturatus]|uniref:kinesin-like protein KIF12 isoform X2 n=1 Tax=Centruroides sculpturatus TaxID=218467 RepID=UPI000C6DFC7D|nr:kinesin-like protein KIF12 isoform X2 [Centruroides sculpturatus]
MNSFFRRRRNLYTRPSTAASEDSIMSADTDEINGDYDNINVVVRVRPLTMQEAGKKDIQVVHFPADGQIMVDDQISGQTRVFTYNVVFEPEASQNDVFEYCGIKKMIDMALDGFACTVLAYGQTGAGKTYTLTGVQCDGRTGEKVQGVVQMAFDYLFEQVELRRELNYIVQASYLEVYKEQVFDLLNPSAKGLTVRWSKERGFYAENLFVVECEDAGDLEGVLEEGRKNRQVRSHNMNEHSSRSHTILVLMMTSEMRDPEDSTNFIRRHGKLSLVDLAGSEKTKKTNSKGETLKEANNINKSLLVLGNCISALADPRKRNGHIPYRDSTLTKLLADSFGGSGMALMIACISPSRANTSETLNTLRYASRAKRIKTKPIIRMDPREQLILSLKREVKLLRMENDFLRQQLNIGGDVTFGRPGSISIEDMKTDEVKSMLYHYMQENENLREENASLHEMRDLLTRDHELVCRENEKLSQRLANMGRKFSPSSASPDYQDEGNSHSLNNSYSSQQDLVTNAWSSAGSRRSLNDLDGDMERESAEYMDFTKRTPSRVKVTNRSWTKQFTPEKRKVGRSLTDITETAENSDRSAKASPRPQRWNSWGNGISQGSDRSKINKSINNGSAEVEDDVTIVGNSVMTPTPPPKLPPLISKLMPVGVNNRKSAKMSIKTKQEIDENSAKLAKDLQKVQKAMWGET